VNRLDPFYECIHDELLPKESFLRNGKPHDVPARFQIWVRRDKGRENLVERKDHPDLNWVPKSRSPEATIWICRRGPDLGNIIEAIGITTPAQDHYGIRCSAEAVAILRSIRWRDVLDPLPSNHVPNMSQADIVRAYEEALENAQHVEAKNDDEFFANPDKDALRPYIQSMERAVTTQSVAEPIVHFDEPDETPAVRDEPITSYTHYDDPYHSFGGGVRICKYPQTARFIANVQVPLDFDLGAHLQAMFGPETAS
jgi:hypothetical protein